MYAAVSALRAERDRLREALAVCHRDLTNICTRPYTETNRIAMESIAAIDAALAPKE